MIPQHIIDQILEKIDLVDLISKYVPLKKSSGHSYVACCPFHQEKTPSFHVNRSKQFYHCFGCQVHGNAINFLMEYENRTFGDVIQQLSKETGIDLPKNNLEPQNISYTRKTTDTSLTHTQANITIPEQKEGNLYDLLEQITQYYQQQLAQNVTAQNYFKQRGLTEQSIQMWRLGYAPANWQHLIKVFPQDIEGLKILGLIRSNENGRDFCLLRERVIFPIRDHRGKVVGFGGRALNDEIKPKYINSPESDVFHKNKLLYGLYEGSQQRANQWLMVEGYMDVIALHQNGIYGAVATLGTASNTEHLMQLFRRNPHLTLAFDGDAAGQKAARRTLEIALPLLQDGFKLQFFVLPEDHDPDSLIRQYGTNHFKQLWEQSPLLSEFLFALLSQAHDINTPEGKSLVMGDLKPLVHLLPKNNTFSKLLVQYFKEKLGLGFRFNQKIIQNDANLSYAIHNRTEDHVIAILMLYPSLYIHFEALRRIIDPKELLADILNIFHQIYEKLPENPQNQSYYILGACADYQYEIDHIMQHLALNYLQNSIEKTDLQAQDFSLSLQKKYLKQQPLTDIKTLDSIRKRINEIDQKISFKN